MRDDALYGGMRAALCRVPLDGFSARRPVKDGRGRRPPNDAPLISAELERAVIVHTDDPDLSSRSTLGCSGRVVSPRVALARVVEFSSSCRCLPALPFVGKF